MAATLSRTKPGQSILSMAVNDDVRRCLKASAAMSGRTMAEELDAILRREFTERGTLTPTTDLEAAS